MTHSRNEIEALARKAARGAGMSWGMAEEAGQAVTWLAARFDRTLAHYADYLGWRDGRDHAAICPVAGPPWQANGGALCPFVAGVALLDGIGNGGPVEFGSMAYPVFVIPFAWQRARVANAPSTLRWTSTCVLCTPAGVSLSGETADLWTRSARTMVFTPGETGDKGHLVDGATRITSDAGAIARLDAFAHRTHAPATEADRLSGAGAGLSDND